MRYFTSGKHRRLEATSRSRALVLAFLLILASVDVFAQVGIPFPGPGGVAGSAVYTGPLDIVSGATAAYGLRALSTTFADGTHVGYNIARSADSDTCDVLFDTSGNPSHVKQDAGAHASCGTGSSVTTVTWCASGCALIKPYDQTGNGRDFITNNVLGTPTFTPSATISSIATGTAGVAFCTSATVSMPQIVSVSTVYKHTSAALGTTGAFDNGPSQVGGNSSADQAFLYGGSAVVTAAATDNVYHAVQAIFNGASSELYIDGSATTGLNGGTGSSTAAKLCIFGLSNDVNMFPGSTREVIFWPNASAASFASSLAALNSNQRAYWGF